MSTVDVLVISDPTAFTQAGGSVKSPLGAPTTWKQSVQMITEHEHLHGNQGQWDLEINVHSGDIIRWWDTTVVQESPYDMIIVDFHKYSNWSTYLSDPVAETHTTGWAYIRSGFGTNEIQYDSVSFPKNFAQTEVKNVTIPQGGVSISYNFVLAKLDVSNIKEVKPFGYYYIDPVIYLYP